MMPGDLLHHWLVLLLLVMLVGHISMAILHRAVWKDDVLHRMAGV
jgi:cytochrome b561